MGELIPPGSLVEVDTQQNVAQTFAWRAMRERPIYLVWHAHGYTCCWCQQERGELVMLPHPSSNQPVRHVKTPRDATIVGRIVAAWMSFFASRTNRGAGVAARIGSKDLPVTNGNVAFRNVLGIITISSWRKRKTRTCLSNQRRGGAGRFLAL
jgi:hypothetical protein